MMCKSIRYSNFMLYMSFFLFFFLFLILLFRFNTILKVNESFEISADVLKHFGLLGLREGEL